MTVFRIHPIYIGFIALFLSALPLYLATNYPHLVWTIRIGFYLAILFCFISAAIMIWKFFIRPFRDLFRELKIRNARTPH